MENLKFSYRLDEPNADVLVCGFMILKPNGGNHEHVTLEHPQPFEEAKFRAEEEVAIKNGAPVPKKPRPPAEVKGIKR